MSKNLELEGYIKDAKEIIEKISECYNDAILEKRAEIRKEFEIKEENNKKTNEQARIIYNKIVFRKDISKILIKKNLPIRVRMFNKIDCTSWSLQGDIITIGFAFNEDWGNIFYQRFHYEYVERIYYKNIK